MLQGRPRIITLVLILYLIRSLSGTVFDDSFWLELNYLEVAMVAQSCAAHFTALLYTEIYADKINLDKQQKRYYFLCENSSHFSQNRPCCGCLYSGVLLEKER